MGHFRDSIFVILIMQKRNLQQSRKADTEKEFHESGHMKKAKILIFSNNRHTDYGTATVKGDGT